MSKILSIVLPTLALLAGAAWSQSANAGQPDDEILHHMNQCMLSDDGKVKTFGEDVECCYDKGCVICSNKTNACIFQPARITGGGLGMPGVLTNPHRVAPTAPTGLNKPTGMPPVRILERSDPTAATPGRTRPAPGSVLHGTVRVIAPAKKAGAAATATPSAPTKPGHVWVNDHWERERSKR